MSQDTSNKISAWTKVGDVVSPPGQWTIYTLAPHRLGALEPEPKGLPFNTAQKATEGYEKRANKLRRGGIFLVTPTGTVAAYLWLPPLS